MEFRANSLRWLSCVILSLFFISVVAQEQQSIAVNQGDGGNTQWQNAQDGGDRGRIALDEATALLRQIQPTGGRISRFNKPTGVLGSTAYYAKELFFLLFMNGPPQDDSQSRAPSPQKLNPILASAKERLEEAAANNSPDAIFWLAEMNFHGNYSHPRNYHEAFRRYSELAALDGNATAQHMLGFIYATGIGGAVERDQAKAMVYHKFAAEGGEVRSKMTMGFRYHTGVATPRSCEDAVEYYQEVAQKAMEYMRSGPPGGHSMVRESYRLADEVGGIYGEGASVSSAGPMAKHAGPSPDDHGTFDNVMEYLDLISRKGDVKAIFTLGRLYYGGSRAIERDLKQAKERFLTVARQYWHKDGRIRNDAPPNIEKWAPKAAGYLGRMFLRGEGMPQSFEIAQTWFKRGIASGDALCQYSMGLMYLYGLGVVKDPLRAADYLTAAADQDLPSAQVRMGALFLDQGDVNTAQRYFELAAARHGHIEAFYFLAEMAEKGVGRDRQCTVAAAYYKMVAEKAEAIVSPFSDANDAYVRGDIDSALLYYMMAAEQGYEYGQANVAYILDKSEPQPTILSSILPFLHRKTIEIRNATSLALLYWTRSAKQSNIDSMVKMGDYYLMGIGTTRDREKAAACYQAAAETMQSAQAMWNLGWMHENGIGIEQDFHLAKRLYDQALETNQEAYLPVTLALYKLRLRSFWNDLTHGNIKSIEDDPEPERQWSLSEWVANFLYEADAQAYEYFEPEDWDTNMPGGEDQMPGGDGAYYDDIDDGVLESLIIVSLALALAFLVFYRQQRQLGHRRAVEQQQQQQNNAVVQGGQQGGQREEQEDQQGDRGVFPRPDDPEFNNWVAGGVGH